MKDSIACFCWAMVSLALVALAFFLVSETGSFWMLAPLIFLPSLNSKDDKKKDKTDDPNA